MKRQHGNLFRVLVRECHTKRARYINHVEICTNQMYHNTIEATPHKTRYGAKLERDWTTYVDSEIVGAEVLVEHEKIYLRIRDKGDNVLKKMTRTTTL